MVLTAGTVISAEVKRRKKGIRKLWGTGRLINVNQGRNGIWWFELNSSEKLLVEVESLYGIMTIGRLDSSPNM